MAKSIQPNPTEHTQTGGAHDALSSTSSSSSRRSAAFQNGAQLLGLADKCDDSDAAAGGRETIKTKKMRIKRRHEGHELHKTKRRLTETLATVHEAEEEDIECQPAVKLQAVKQSADDATMQRRLQCEHLKLQKHFSLVQRLLADTSKRHAKKVSDLEDELRETRERHDLIEFQLLEIEQCQQKGKGKVAEKGVNTFLEGRCCKYGYLLEELMLKRGNLNPVDKTDKKVEMEKQLETEQTEHILVDSQDRRIGESPSPEKSEQTQATTNLKLYIEELQKTFQKNDDSPICQENQPIKRGDEEVESHCTSAASEDEGLGEDSRRDESAGPNSLVLDVEDYQGHFDGVIVDLRKRETNLASQLCQAEARISELQDRLNVKEEQVLRLLSESCNYAMLQEQLSVTEQKKSELQEQVLELEEAENDSRSEAQRLQMVVLTMEERERLLEDEIHRMKVELEKRECRLRGMEITDHELQAQVSYMETLVCKYENHIGELEAAEITLHQKIVELEHNLRIAKKGKADTVTNICQTLKTHSHIEEAVKVEDKHSQTESCSVNDGTSLATGGKDSLISRLKQLEQKDGVLREQLHQMDGINLMLWQKLHSLDNNIELCKKQERRNFSEEAKHQVATARLDDLLINHSPKPENPAGVVGENTVISLEGNDLKLRLVQLEREHDDMRKELETKRIKNDEIIQRIEKEKTELVMELDKVQNEKEHLRESFVNSSELADGCKKCQQLTYAVGQLREDETLLRSDITQHQIRVQEMCSEFQKKMNELTEAHRQTEEQWKNENAILREKEREYQEELHSLRETRKSLKTEIGAMIREKNLVLFELQNKLIKLEDKKNLPHHKMKEIVSKKFTDHCMQTENELFQPTESSQNQTKKCTCNQSASCANECKSESVQTDINTAIDISNLESTAELISTIQQLKEKGQLMERRIDELQKKEAAYIETLENADKIISNLERGYQEKIVQLESSEKNLRQRVVELEESENQLRGMVYQPERRSSSDGWKISDLVKELTATEARENALKEHADEVEASHRTLLQRVSELEKSNHQFREETQEQEELLGSMREKERELKLELTRLQQSENALRVTLHQADEILAQRERGVLDEVERLEKEKLQLEETIDGLRDEMAALKVNHSSVVATQQFDKKDEGRPLVSLDDLNVGMEARQELEVCMTRAMAAMERDMERKSSIDERENIRSSDSTSGCESDCSSTYIWPTSEDSDSDHAVDEPKPKKMLISSSEIPAIVPSRVTYPNGTYTRLDKKSKITHEKKDGSSFAGDKNAESRVKVCKKANEDSTNQPTDLLLPPENFSILRQVGKDSLLVGWRPKVAKNASISYQIFVDGQLQQNIRSPDRTKALLHKLDLTVPLNISIRSISAEGDVSEPTCAFFTATAQSTTPTVKV